MTTRQFVRQPAQDATDTGAGGGAAADKAAADKAAADTAAADKAAADKATADKAAADKTAADKTAADKAAADKAAGNKAPEKYDLKLPDGGRLDAADLKVIEEMARKNGWTNDDAQAAIAEHDATIKAQADRFLAETKADKEYGGDKLEETQKLARAVIAKIRPEGHPRREAFLRFMNRGGAGNHAEVIGFLADLGKLMAEDGAVGGSGGSGAVKDAATTLYGANT